MSSFTIHNGALGKRPLSKVIYIIGKRTLYTWKLTLHLCHTSLWRGQMSSFTRDDIARKAAHVRSEWPICRGKWPICKGILQCNRHLSFFRVIIEQLIRVLCHKGAVYMQKNHIYMQKNHIYMQKNPIYKAKKPIYMETKPIHTEKKPMYVKKKPIYMQKKPIYMKNNCMWLKKNRNVQRKEAYVHRNTAYILANETYVRKRRLLKRHVSLRVKLSSPLR